MLANAVLMFTSTPTLHHLSFMKNERESAVPLQSPAERSKEVKSFLAMHTFFMLPYFVETYFNMKVNKSPGCEESK